jgi:hypothetical protein
MKLTKEQFLGIVRHSLTFIGGILIMRGMVDDVLLNELVGGLTAIAGTIWSIVDKHKS